MKEQPRLSYLPLKNPKKKTFPTFTSRGGYYKHPTRYRGDRQRPERYKSKARHELLNEYPELEDAIRAYEKFERRATHGKAVEGEREKLILGF